MSIKTTIHLTLPAVRRTLDRPHIILGIVMAVVFLLSGILALLGQHSTPTAAAVATPPLPIIIIASPTFMPATPAGAQVAATGANITPRALVAYDAPDGRALGAIEQGRPYQVLASWGAAWLQADVTGSGVVWLRAADLLGMPAGLVDLQPTPAPRVVVVSAPAAPEQRYQVEAAPTPAQCYHSERQAMVHGISVGLATGDSCVSQQDANEQAARSAFAQMNAALQGNH